ncbi:MAG: hypothetical protein A3F14_03920 [Gammaproteobacteria bacterium RIFCSPHIGHO2_12_FULL_43_28]|nr:MAG: hypothetical protein A3F14_03920 [Gammaproteobacteria bacterium RIFCSPHIGHO2_12_FULL_43_28]
MKKFTNIALIAALISTVNLAFAETKAVTVAPAEKAKIEQVVKQYLSENPEIIIEAVQGYQRKQYEQAEQTVKQTQKNAPQYVDALFRQANDPIAGNPNGKVTVVEFFDYQCPHCVDMAPVIQDVVKANPEVRIVFKEFPIRGPISEYAARAALAANKQNKYVPFQHALLTSKQPLSQEVVLKIATETGLNVEQLKKDMHDESVNSQIKATYQLAQNLKLFGTPAFFIGKTNATKDNATINYIPGQLDKTQLQGEIDKASK